MSTSRRLRTRLMPTTVRVACAILLFVAISSSRANAIGGQVESASLAAQPAALARTNPCTPPIVNPIVCENSLPGTPPSIWAITGAADSTIASFATDISFNLGDTVPFKINTPATAYTIDIYRMGYYKGKGARLVTSIAPSAPLPQTQPACLSDSTTQLYDCGNWAVSASWTIPTTSVSGVYVAKLTRTDTGGANQIFFVVRDDASTSDLLVQTSDTTWQAYNDYGGASLYAGSNLTKGVKVSYNRPFNANAANPNFPFFPSEYPNVRWLESNGYNVSYFAGVDSDRRGNLILNHRVFLTVGHDEYWSNGQRNNIQAARDDGVSLAFFSGNLSAWKTRWEPSIDGTNTNYRTLVTYKETAAGHPIDPLDPPFWTGTWRDNRFSPPADGGRPENALTGQLATVGADGNTYPIKIPQADGQMRFWRNTSIATQPVGHVTTISAGCSCILGYEWDTDVDNGLRPAGIVHLSTTTQSVSHMIIDPFGAVIGPGVATHHLTLYRAPSGALVFGAGTIDWSLGLDGNGSPTSTPDVNMQQATVNLFADMRVQPGTLASGLVRATASTDTIPPSSQITSPSNGSILKLNGNTTIKGSAADTGGGVVGGVEVSVDGGVTWHPTTGRAQWTYQWKPTTRGAVTILSRAVDDSGNVETPGAGISVTVG